MATYSDGPTASSTSSGATLNVTGVTAAVGVLATLFCAADNAGTAGASSTSSGITDAAGNTWTLQSQVNYSPGGAANDGTTWSMWTSTITSALVAATITLNFSPNTGSKTAAMQFATPAAGCAMAIESVGAGATFSSTGRNISATVRLGSTILAASAIEANGALTTDSDTTNGSWSTALTVLADTGTAGTSQMLSVQRKTVTASGSQTYNTTTGSSRDAAVNYLIVYETVSGSLAATGTADAAAFAGLAGLAGTLAATDPADTADFDGSLANVGTLAARDRRDRAAFTFGVGWPAELPKPTVQGYGMHPAAAVERRAMEFGAPRVYRRTKKPVVSVDVVWQVDADQQARLDGFRTTELQDGTLWFGLTLLLPSGLETVSARFKDKFAIRARGGTRWQTTATLELLDRPVMSEAALTALLDDDGDPPAWPTLLLPLPTVASWELTPKSAVARSDDLPGRPDARQRSRNSTTEVPAAWELSAEQAAVFDAFFRWRARDGAQWFSFPVVQAAGVSWAMVRFLGTADWTPRGGGRWAVTAAIEIRERSMAGGAMLDFSVPANSQYVPTV